ncbi:dipeptidylpeptidase, partial [Linderina pennispora]
ALFTQSHYDQDENKSATFINLLDLASGNITRLTEDAVGSSFTSPLWFDDTSFGYIRKNVLYQQPLQEGANATEVFAPPIDISSVKYLKESGLLAFIADVYPDCALHKTRELQDAEKHKIDSAQVYDNLWPRHWNEWMGLRKSTLFVAPLTRPGSTDERLAWVVGNETNLMHGLPAYHDPMIRWSVDEYTVDTAGSRAAFVTRKPKHDMTSSTDVDVYVVDTSGSNLQLLTGNVDGMASGPTFSQDGQLLAWLQMETGGYESDINRIYVHNLAKNETTSIARDWDLTPSSLLWSSDARTLFAIVGDKGHNVVYAIDVATGQRNKLTERGTAGGLRRLSQDKLLLTHGDTNKCTNIHVLDTSSKELRQLTDVNQDKLRDVYVGDAEDFWFTGARGDKVHGWLVKPHNFDPSKKYPVAYLVHGGPQQANLHTFSYAQWNPNMYASAGFVAVQVNFHGSPTYGQNFTDSIRLQWGGYPYEDLMKGLDYLIQHYEFVDKDRMVALGASYGGYMMNWFNGHTRRFKALVNHDGMFSAPMFWYSTEELWFPEHDFNGVPYKRSDRAMYEKWNPERFADQFQTPTLFIQGEKDFRLTVDNSIGPFTLLRHKGVAARLMYFPDEDHWTNHIGNSVRWYTEVLRWISEHTNNTLPYELEL